MDSDNAPAALPRPGDTIAGKYAIVRVIGEGGMGIVYEANHLRLRRRVALKMLHPHMMATSSDTVARFEREARATAQLRGRHVTKVLDVDTTADGLPYLVMEYLEGHDLEAELNARGPLPFEEAVAYVLQVCAAMTEAHDAGIVHRDLKPSNLFLCPDRDGAWIVKVLDFGISKMADDGDARLTATQASVGTPLYMSPEQVRSSRNVDSRTDIWALGVILYELLAGRTPFEGSTTAAAASIVADPVPPLRYFREDVPPALHDAIDRALEKDPAARFATVTEFAQAIVPFSGPIQPSVAPPPPPSASALTPEPHSRAVTPAPHHPSHPSHAASRASYPRAPEGASTLAVEEVPRTASPTPAVMPALQAPSASRRRLVVGGSAGLLLVALAVVFFTAQRGVSPHAAASAPPPPPVSPVVSAASSAPPATAETAQRPVAAAATAPAAAAPAPPAAAPTTPRPPPLAVTPRPAPRPQPAPAASTPPAAPPPNATPQAHGTANPLFL